MSERNLDFDTVIKRDDTKSLKYDFRKKRGYSSDVIPLWVADMDFRTSSYIEDALKSVAERNIYGYTNVQAGDGFFDSVSRWMKKYHDWDVREEWHVITPGVVFAIGMAIRAFTNEGDPVLIQYPVYYPFSDVIRNNGRKIVSSDLVRDENGRYSIDFDDFEQKIVRENIKLYILCNPQNPVGRAWTKEELQRLGDICKKHGTIVFSDEIHFDFVWNGDHNIFTKTDPSFGDFSIVATSPSKTFNLAGLQESNIFIQNPELRKRFSAQIAATGYDEPNIFGVEAAQAAYENGDVWYEAMRRYVGENIDYVTGYVNEILPGVKTVKPEGTYLVWLDFTELGLHPKDLDDLIVNKAGLWLDSGRIFGKTGEGFQRINAACPRSILESALSKLENALCKNTKLAV